MVGDYGNLQPAGPPEANCDHVDMQARGQPIYQKPDILVFAWKSPILKMLHSCLNIKK